MKYSIAFTACFFLFQSVSANAYPIAGVAPSQRPEGAPVVSTVANAAQLETRLLHGITKPVPESIQHWVKDQGGWFNPFSRPGMPGRYDLRGWHDGKKAGS